MSQPFLAVFGMDPQEGIRVSAKSTLSAFGGDAGDAFFYNEIETKGHKNAMPTHFELPDSNTPVYLAPF